MVHDVLQSKAAFPGNRLAADGDALIPGAGGPPATGLAEPLAFGDELDAVSSCDATGRQGQSVFFTLAPGSPTLGMITVATPGFPARGATAGDVLTIPFGAGGVQTVAFPFELLGSSRWRPYRRSLRLRLRPKSPSCDRII